MSKEEIQALYERAQAESRGGQLYEYFAKLVEQATLERAAIECERSEMYRGCIFAARIRKLKEPQE